jgi:hypothetical protein
MTYDSHRRAIVMYGGWGSSGPLQDLWEWDGAWTPIASSGCLPAASNVGR